MHSYRYKGNSVETKKRSHRLQSRALCQEFSAAGELGASVRTLAMKRPTTITECGDALFSVYEYEYYSVTRTVYGVVLLRYVLVVSQIRLLAWKELPMEVGGDYLN